MQEILDEVMYTGINHPERMPEYFKKPFKTNKFHNANYFDSIEDVLERHAFWFGLSSWDTYKDGTAIRELIKNYIDNERREIKEKAYDILNNSKIKYVYSIMDTSFILEREPDIYKHWQDHENHMDYFENLIKEWQEEQKTKR